MIWWSSGVSCCIRFLAFDRAINSAAALTYTTLFAVVPVMTVTFAMLSAVPAFQDTGEQIQNFIFRNFVPSSATVQQYLRDFTTQARHLTWGRRGTAGGHRLFQCW